MDPSGPAQPTLNQAYNTAGNPADQSAQEQRSSSINETSNSGAQVEQRQQGDVPVPSTHDGEGGQNAGVSALGYGGSGEKDRGGPVRYSLHALTVTSKLFYTSTSLASVIRLLEYHSLCQVKTSLEIPFCLHFVKT